MINRFLPRTPAWAFVATMALALAAGPAMAKAGAKATFVKGKVEVGKAESGKFKKLKRNKRVKRVSLCARAMPRVSS